MMGPAAMAVYEDARRYVLEAVGADGTHAESRAAAIGTLRSLLYIYEDDERAAASARGVLAALKEIDARKDAAEAAARVTT